MKTGRQFSESLVMANDMEQHFRYKCIVEGSLNVRSKTLSTDEGNIEYIEGKDFLVDYKEGLIWRTQYSTIPNWGKHVLYGKSDFDHKLYEDCSNRKYTIYADYVFETGNESLSGDTKKCSSSNKLNHVIEKCSKGEAINYVVFGDSISAGGDASREEFTFYNRFADKMRSAFNKGYINVINKAVAGETSSDGMKRFENDVLGSNPDLVSIGYGMNDQCRMDERTRNGVPPDLFEKNIREMVEKIKKNTSADIILITPCISNPLWIHSGGDIHIYSGILRNIAGEYETCIADVYELWVNELNAGKSHESLLLNNINHPNDYGHWIYCKALECVL